MTNSAGVQQRIFPRDAMYFRVSSDRQTTENQFTDVLDFYNQELTKSQGSSSPFLLAETLLVRLRTSVKEIPSPTAKNPSRVVFKAVEEVVEDLAEDCIYVEQGKSSKTGSSRPLFEQMKADAKAGRFNRLLVWKVSRLGRDMREVLNTVYDMADLGVTVVPVKSNTGPITSAMGKLLWHILAWLAEMENVERVDAINAGIRRARGLGTHMGRPKRVFDRERARELRRGGMPVTRIAETMQVPETTLRRMLDDEI